MINVDISNIWGDLSLMDLLGMEAEVFAAHAALSDGTGAGSGFLGWMDLPTTEPTRDLSRIQMAASRIRENSDICVVLGIGGCVLGAQAAIELLQGPDRNLGRGKGDPQIFFAGNDLSTRHWNALHHLLEGKDFSVIVISKSGGNLEPTIALRGLKWMLERRYGSDGSRKRVYAVTDETRGTLRRMAGAEGWESFPIPEDVGSPFSVLSPAGLLPMAVAGIDILALLRGAALARREYDLRSFENPVWLYAATRSLMYRSGKKIELLAAFDPDFDRMGAWWQQLFAQAEGKDGKGLFPATALLTRDLHTLGQLVQQGERNLFETMVRFAPPEKPLVIGEDARNLDGLNYLSMKNLDYVEEQAYLATVANHTDSGVPVICVDCGVLDEGKLGELFYFFQLSCGICGYLLGINPFEQPAVEICMDHLLRQLGSPGME